MWSAARIDLGLSSEEFWGLCPRQLLALLKRQKLQLHRAEFGPAMITATLVNLVQRPKKPASPMDFMPSMQRKGPRKPAKSVEHMMAIAKAVTLSMGGTIHGSQSG